MRTPLVQFALLPEQVYSQVVATSSLPTDMLMLLTGRYPAQVGITDWIRAEGQHRSATVHGRKYRERSFVEVPRGHNPDMLNSPNTKELDPHKETSFAVLLKAAGYTTYFAGKWHLGSAVDSFHCCCPF